MEKDSLMLNAITFARSERNPFTWLIFSYSCRLLHAFQQGVFQVIVFHHVIFKRFQIARIRQKSHC